MRYIPAKRGATAAAPSTRGDPECPLCHGAGGRNEERTITTETQSKAMGLPIGYVSDHFILCRCAHRRMVEGKLGKLAEIPELASSELLPIGPDGRLTDDLSARNLRITGRWQDVGPHVRAVVTWQIERCMRQGMRCYEYLCCTDADILRAYVGETSTDDDATGLYAYVADRALVIVRTGFMGGKNVAAPGALHEALLTREALNRPTWLIDSHERPWKKGNHSWSSEAEEAIADWDRIDFDMEPES